MTDDVDPDLRDLVAGWAGRELPPERYDALLDRLEDDAGFRRAFAAEVWTLGQVLVAEGGEPPSMPTPDAKVRAGAEVPKPARRRRWPSIAAIAAGVFAAVAVWWGTRAAAPPGPGDGLPADGLAVLAYAAGVEWEPGSEPAIGTVLTAGRVALRSGVAVLSCFGGETLTVEGPADVELVNPDRTFLHRGRMRVRLTSRSNYTVFVPGGAVIDHGTEFGLDVGADGRTRVTVFSGSVEALLLPPDGVARGGRGLVAGQSLTLDPMKGEFTSDPEAVVPAEVQVPLPVLTLDPGYPALVRESKPWGYWRFERIGNEGVANEVAGRPALRAFGGVAVTGEAGARVAVFPPAAKDRYFLADGPWTPPKSGFAIEFWAMPELVSIQTMAGLIAPPTEMEEPHVALVEINGRRPVWLSPPGTVRFLYRLPPGDVGGTDLFSDRSRPCVPYRWHHLVAQRDDDRMELYVNGALCGIGTAAPGEPPPCRLMIGQLKRKDNPKMLREFVGLMDEVAVYDRPLTVDEVRRHAAGGR